MAMHLTENERLAAVSKEYHVRKQNGKYLAYIVEDKTHAAPLMLAQKISLLVDAINAMVPDKCDRVSVTGLYQIIDNNGERVGGWSKHRWRVRPYALEEAAGAFEDARPRFERAMLIGSQECYRTVCT